MKDRINGRLEDGAISGTGDSMMGKMEFTATKEEADSANME